MGWSDTEELLCVQDDGLVIIYDMFGEEKHTFSMGQEASCTKVNQYFSFLIQIKYVHIFWYIFINILFYR